VSAPAAFASIPELVEEIRAGRMVVILDDEARENEGDLIMAASLVRPEDINFMAREGRGLICLAMSRARCRQLRLAPMVRDNRSPHRTDFQVSIEAAEGVSTGISAHDRAHTIRTAVAPDARPEHLTRPGHIFPLMAQTGGVLRRAGHTETACDLARLAGLEPAGVLVEILNEDGTMARRPQLERFADRHGLKLGTVAELIRYRREQEPAEPDAATGEGGPEAGARLAFVRSEPPMSYHVSRDLPRVALDRFEVQRIEPVARRKPRIAVVASRFNDAVVDRLVEGALAHLEASGLAQDEILLMRVPGAWELPVAARALALSGRCDAIVALGCVIRGETMHYELISNESARGLAEIATSTGVPIANGVLSCEDAAQALARAGGADGNKGEEAARAALEMAALLGQLR
jgi:6,7-dimethyl-8-ribityllumazine synthase